MLRYLLGALTAVFVSSGAHAAHIHVSFSGTLETPIESIGAQVGDPVTGAFDFHSDILMCCPDLSERFYRTGSFTLSINGNLFVDNSVDPGASFTPNTFFRDLTNASLFGIQSFDFSVPSELASLTLFASGQPQDVRERDFNPAFLNIATGFVDFAKTSDGGPGANLTYPWRASVDNVVATPLPPGVLLFLSALAGLAALRRRLVKSKS